VAGVVEQVGSECALFKPGDEVYYAGSITRPGGDSEFHLVDERIVRDTAHVAITRIGNTDHAFLCCASVGINTSIENPLASVSIASVSISDYHRRRIERKHLPGSH
jgi:hypothetical protein